MLNVHLLNRQTAEKNYRLNYRQLLVLNLHQWYGKVFTPSHSSVAKFLDTTRIVIFNDYNFLLAAGLLPVKESEIFIPTKQENEFCYFRFYKVPDFSLAQSVVFSFWLSEFSERANIVTAAGAMRMSQSGVSSLTNWLIVNQYFKADRTPTIKSIELVKEIERNGIMEIKPANSNAGKVSEASKARAGKKVGVK